MRSKWGSLALRALYWITVLAVSLAIVFLLVLLFESLDQADVDEGAGVLTPLWLLRL